MALPKIEEARKLSDEELIEQIKAVKKELFGLRFKKSTNQSEEKTHLVKHTRHRQAQLMTVQRERELAAARTTPAEEAVAEVAEAEVAATEEAEAEEAT
ncbi:MAG: 50S ribosomal protein L29 [Hormoscilla sp. GM7CHS1pb]|nr:50S ribosomal protein L29 [Hormoscilla sp. GM7CHS1pb]